jgi:hypothetical protein
MRWGLEGGFTRNSEKGETESEGKEREGERESPELSGEVIIKVCAAQTWQTALMLQL